MQKKATSWICAITAYVLWGLLPLYWRLLNEISAPTILAHRVIWSAVCLLVLITFMPRFRVNLSGPLSLSRYGICALALSVNWGLYIWAVSNHLLLAASLGYFLAPLFYSMAGVWLWKERLEAIRVWALCFGSLGLVPLLCNSDLETFAVAIGLASSIVFYGSLRKGSKLPQVPALTLESIILCPLAFLYLGDDIISYSQHAIEMMRIPWLLIGAGPVTLIPLLFYGKAVKDIPLNQIAFLQYISPTLQFFLAILFFGERVDTFRLSSFILIWIGILILCIGLLYERKRLPRIQP